MKLRPWILDKDKQIKMLDFPIAILPLLRVGAFYKDDEITDYKTMGIILM